jgi:N-acetylmuramoyl-L-alanine amidase
MKKIMVLGALITFLIFSSGCAKKEAKEEMSLESDQVMNETELVPQSESAVSLPETKSLTAGKVTSAATTLPQAVASEKPTPRDIQQALKNAGVYASKVDGIIGPKTKQAIESFQAKNNLTADGQVGPKTWAVLKTYQNRAAQASSGASD